MTLRERLADWISGGALTRARANAQYERLVTQKYHKIFLKAEVESTLRLSQAWTLTRKIERRDDALEAIAAATHDGKSGTARKIHRMATEALK